MFSTLKMGTNKASSLMYLKFQSTNRTTASSTMLNQVTKTMDSPLLMSQLTSNSLNNDQVSKPTLIKSLLMVKFSILRIPS
mmetsp:Transcript_39085/g.59587  ORF Transcript_39085/g.59587 Transcript_39085/m.59587 type:complete len:81 (+) Transcript_39085:4362-4604(+)